MRALRDRLEQGLAAGFSGQLVVNGGSAERLPQTSNVAFLGIEYGVLFATGQLMTSSQPLLTIVGFQFVPVFIIIGTVASYLFWKTGRIFTGVVVLTLLVPSILVASTAVQGIPW